MIVIKDLLTFAQKAFGCLYIGIILCWVNIKIKIIYLWILFRSENFYGLMPRPYKKHTRLELYNERNRAQNRIELKRNVISIFNELLILY